MKLIQEQQGLQLFFLNNTSLSHSLNSVINRSVEAEDLVLNSNLNKKSILRLSGLYSSTRGPHSYWLKQIQSLPPDEGNIINLIHYEDAAKASIKVLEKGHLFIIL